MSELFDSLPERGAHQGAWGIVFATTPADFADRVSVIIPSIDPNLRWEDCRWMSRNDLDLPNRGDEGLGIFNENNEIWVVAWWPA